MVIGRSPSPGESASHGWGKGLEGGPGQWEVTFLDGTKQVVDTYEQAHALVSEQDPTTGAPKGGSIKQLP